MRLMEDILPVSVNKVIFVDNLIFIIFLIVIFKGKMIKATFIPLATYHQKFPDSINRTEILKPSL